jgi:transposase-like protein
MNSSKTGLVRRRKTAQERQRLVARFHESQMTQRDFAVRHGIGMSTLSKWLRVESEATPAPVKFQEVKLPNMPLRYAVEEPGCPPRKTCRKLGNKQLPSPFNCIVMACQELRP